MAYNPLLHNRRSIRLQGYDYSQAGAYFITICTYTQRCIFGEIEKCEMKLSLIGKEAYHYWLQIPYHYDNVELDEFVIMPNHIHGIVVINNYESVRAGFTPAQNIESEFTALNINPIDCQHQENGQPQGLPVRLGDIIGAYKSLVANEILKYYKSQNKFMGKLWHRNYFEHVIRDEEDYSRIVDYIRDNPLNWEKDELY